MGTDARIEADTVNNLLGIQTVQLRVGVKLVEERDPHGKVGIGKQLHRFRFREAHEQGVDLLLQGALHEQVGKGVGGIQKPLVLQIRTHNNPAGIQVVVQCFGLAQKFRAEENVGVSGFLADTPGKSNRDGGFDDHKRVGIDPGDNPDHRLNGRGVEEILLRVVIGRCRNHHKFGVGIGGFRIQRGGQIQRLLRKKAADLRILNGRNPIVNLRNFFRDNIHSGHFVMLRQQHRQRQPHIPGSRDSDFHTGIPSFFRSFNAARMTLSMS